MYALHDAADAAALLFDVYEYMLVASSSMRAIVQVFLLFAGHIDVRYVMEVRRAE